LLQTPLFWLFDGALWPLRLLSVLLGAGVVVLAYGVAGQLFPGRPWLALTVAAFVAFLPQHVAMMAAVNNDSLAELLIGAILFLLLRLVVVGEEDLTQRRKDAKELRKGIGEQWSLIFLGVVLGLGFLTKVTVYIMVPVVGLGLAGRYWGRWPALGQAGLLVFGPAILLGLPWWARNAAVYGGLDVLGIIAHNQVVVGQPRTAEWIVLYGPAGTLGRFLQTTFQSFWGQFGWMGVVMKPWVYRLLLLLSLAAVAGLGWALARHRPAGQARLPFAILASTFALSLLLYLAYNATFVQHQGRYLFPALIPISLGVAAGLSAWLRPALARWPAVAYLLPAGLALALFGLDLFALFRFIVPALT
ncbi:MAG: phospholipid carrier-dependent glycosyltransferase, partial [Chloroflexi bacterium]|nr:phospholipid carrier-dependent glycosyltransferase [Chloroflexota bacterium]